jgi:hypothetical protein
MKENGGRAAGAGMVVARVEGYHILLRAIVEVGNASGGRMNPV